MSNTDKHSTEYSPNYVNQFVGAHQRCNKGELSMNPLYSMMQRKLIPSLRLNDPIIRFERVEIEHRLDSCREPTVDELESVRCQN